MREFDNNLKARLADYVNGLPVKLTESEINLMADDDDLAAEVLEIAAISKEAGVVVASANEQGRGKTIRMIIMSLAACLVIGLSLGLVFQSAKNDGNVAPQGNSALTAASAPDRGFANLPEDFESLLQTASSRSSFDHKPNEAFDLTLGQAYDDDTLVLCNANGQELLKAKVNGDIVPIEGLSEGLYYYYLIYNPKEKGALAIGWDE